MGLFAVRKLSWREPEAYRRAHDPENEAALAKFWWPRLLFVLFYTLSIVFIWSLKIYTQHKTLEDLVWHSAWAAISVSLFLYGFPWLLRKIPASVVLYSNSIIKMGQQTPRPLKLMAGFEWSNEDSYYVLHLVATKGPSRSYGVPDAATRDKIEAALLEFGLPKTSTQDINPTHPSFGT